MAREEAIKGLKVLAKDFNGYKPNEEMFDMAIKALEQEPCEDAVDRKAVDQNIYDYAESNGLSYANLKNAILDVPSVTPTRKKGKWITKPHVYGVTYCSECDFELKIDNTNFCPNCGTEMEEE